VDYKFPSARVYEGGRGMLRSHKTSIKISQEYSNIIGHMCYAASKLWNICNYERHHYKELRLEKYPDWYYQKKAHKGNLWYKQLPSQTAQETCKQHLNTAKDRFQQAQSILEAQFSSEENQTGAELVQLTSQALQDTEQAIEAQGGDLNTKAQLALCRFLGAYAIAMNQ